MFIAALKLIVHSIIISFKIFIKYENNYIQKAKELALQLYHYISQKVNMFTMIHVSSSLFLTFHNTAAIHAHR